jgi:UDP:flavonoid glycosyltransferase YjiC (YdhE family)
LLDVLVAGDHTLYADVPELVPLDGAPFSHTFLGPVLWSPDVPLPRELDAAASHAPLVYVTLGSSGDLRAVGAVLRALARLPVRVLLATAGRFEHAALPANTVATRYAPGSEAARRAALVICNGGSSTGYQALHEGVPVLGLPFNFDQSLSMQAIERAGAGLALTPDAVSPDEIAFAVTKLLTDERFRTAARRIGAALRARDAHAVFRGVIERALGASHP